MSAQVSVSQKRREPWAPCSRCCGERPAWRKSRPSILATLKPRPPRCSFGFSLGIKRHDQGFLQNVLHVGV